jgi:RNA polymerase sigma-70 factor (ECF subfamily)
MIPRCGRNTSQAAMPVNGVDLEHALDAARDGDEAGVALLWRSLNPLILRYLHIVVGQAAEDVASETWLLAAREIRQFRGDAAGFRIWLFRVARHRALDELRRAGRRREDPFGLTAEQDWAARDDPAGEAMEQMATIRALRLIAALPPDQAEAVMLRTVIGFDAAHAARILGKRPGAVRVAAMRGLRHLAGTLEAERGMGVKHAAVAPRVAGVAE